MEKDRIMKILIPSVAGIGLLALILFLLLSSDSTGDARPPRKGGHSSATGQWWGLHPSTEGMSIEVPPVDAPEWKDLGGGLKYWDVVEGKGAEVKPGQTVKAWYTGWLTNGEVFDSTFKSDKGVPIEFELHRVVMGWSRGIPGMKPGGIRRLYIPSDLGYGASSPPGIPPNSTLIFEVKLVMSR